MKRSPQLAELLVSTPVFKLRWHTETLPAVHPLCKVIFAANKDKLWLEQSFRGADGKKRRNAVMQIIIILGSATLDFVVVYKDEILGAVEAKYAESF